MILNLFRLKKTNIVNVRDQKKKKKEPHREWIPENNSCDKNTHFSLALIRVQINN